jgi:hypothetical protein
MRLIDADALEKSMKETYCKDCNSYNGVRCRACWVDDACGAIDSAPTIEAEPARSEKWIGIEFDGYADGCPVYYLWECSGCHGEHEGEADTLTDYCPNCGARMDWM